MEPVATTPVQIAFGTDGVRGRVPEQFNEAVVTRLGKAIGTWLQGFAESGRLVLPGVPSELERDYTGSVLVGYDRRPDSAAFATLLTKVLRAYGLQVDQTPSFAPTPAIAYATREFGYDCACILTASHNPYCDNGLKLKPHYGGSATGEITGAIEAALAAPAKPIACATVKGQAESTRDVFSDYAAAVQRVIGVAPDEWPARPLVFDAMHGATTGWLPRMLEGSALDITQLHTALATRETALHPEPLAEWLQECRQAVLSRPGSIGIACDGDGDRLGLIDEQGRFLSSQLFYPLILLSRLKLDQLPVRAIAKTFSGTLLLDRIAAAHGLTLHEVPVGYKYISLLLAGGEIAMGGEESGGLGFVEFIPERDGQLSGLMTLALMRRRKMTLAALLDELQHEFGPVAFERRDLRLTAVVTRAQLEGLLGAATRGGSFAGEAVLRTETLDGVKLWFEGGWLLLRPSGTEPILRIYCEMPHDTRLARLLEAAVVLVREAGLA